MSPLLEVTEDTPPDMLAGSMDLRLVLPDGKRVRMSVDRRTPMMDLLVQVTTAYKISPAGNVLQPYGETGLLPYKPSTPIGALDTWIVHIVPKNQALQNPSNKINLKQIIPPFEQTLRFQVNLPRNQLYVTRVSGRCSMQDILHQACSEKNLDPSKYTLRHPKQLDKPLYDELSIAEYGHNQVTMLSVKSLPTAVSTEDILLMNNKYKTQSDSGSGSAASSVSPVVPVQPSKPIRKRRPAPKPPAQQQPLQKQQSETIICHSRTSSDSSGYHEASVLSESPDSNNSSLPDSLPRRSKLPSAETSNTRETNKLSRSLSNLHQASTSAAANSSLKPAQSVSCLAPSRKKKPAPAPPIAIVEEKEEKSATLPPCTRLMEAPGDERIAVQHQVNSKMPPARDCSPVNTVVPVTRQRISKPKAPVPRPRSLSFENMRLNENVFDKLEVICSKKMDPERQNADSDNARLDAEIERMFDQATREHISLESGVELSRGPSPDWNWEYRLPAPPTFRDDVTVSSLSDLNLSSPLKQILFEPLESTKELIIEESESEIDGIDVELHLEELKPIKEDVLIEDVHTGSEIVHLNSEVVGKHNETNNNKPANNKSSTLYNGEINGETYKQNSKQNQRNIFEEDIVSNQNKTLSDSSCLNIKNSCDSSENIIQITPKFRKVNVENKIVDVKSKIVMINKNNKVREPLPTETTPKTKEVRTDKVFINYKNEEPKESNKSIPRAKVERSDTVIRVNGRVERSQEQSAILNELATVISERQNKPAREVKHGLQQERPQSMPLDNFRITTYTSSKPVQIYKEGRTPQKAAVKEGNVVRRNSFTEEKKGSPSVKRSASAITNLQRRLELSRSNGNLLEVEKTPVRHFQRNLRKTTSELSINIESDEQKGVVRKQETGLQSLQVLRSILPQLSQSQGALNTVGQTNEKKEEKPAISLTTWGERPKRQVSIKTDRDYVVGGIKSEPTCGAGNTSTTTITTPTPVNSSTTSISVEVVSPVTRLLVSPESPVDRGLSRTPRTSVYKAIETGNTKGIKLPDLGRIPVVRGVELKKNPMTSKRPSLENGVLVNGHTSFAQSWLLESKRPSYLFGCEPKAPAQPSVPLAPSMAKLKPVSLRELPKQSIVSDPREELLQSIRNFGKSSLRKVSMR